MTARLVHVLVLEDNPDDAELEIMELERAGLVIEWRRVQTEPDLRRELSSGHWDLVLADYNLPSFHAESAFSILHELAPDVPFIIVSGSIGEEIAVRSMQRGAADYILKDRLARLGQAARKALEAEAANANKREFLNMAAHELRTPLAVLNGYLSLLLDGSLGEPGERWVETIGIVQQKAVELNVLVDSLLTAARVGVEAVDVAQPIDLAGVAGTAVRRAAARAQLSGATLLLEAPPKPVQVLANEAQVARILNVLIDNALNYSEGEPWVKVTVYAEGAVDVEDHGPGVPAGHEEAIFERFHRISDPSHPAPPGTGLGLYIGRELAKRYGGSLELVSSTPLGSRFRLRLPTSAAIAAVNTA